MAIEQFANLASTLVSAGGIDSVATSLPVDSTAPPFPQTGNFRLRIDNEFLLATAVADSTHFTVTRGIEGSTAASHLAGAPVTHLATAGALTAFGADTIGYGADASLPAAARAGMLYLPNDNVTPYLYDGAAWQTFGQLQPFHKPPAAATWTGLNSPPALTEYQGSLRLVPASALAAWAVKGYYRTTPATPYSVDAGFTISTPVVNYWCGGVFWYSSGDGKLTVVYVGLNQANNVSQTSYWLCEKLTNVTTWTAAYNWSHGQANLGNQGSYSGVHWVRLGDNGTNRTVAISGNGLDWTQTFSVGRTDFHTPNSVGWFVNTQNVYWPGSMRLVSWWEH
jgi:hypothetical protein